MDLDYPASTALLRSQAHGWAVQTLARIRREDASDQPNMVPVRWRQAVHAGGWAVPTWPIAYGGRGLSALDSAVVGEAFAAAGAPLTRATGGELLAGPTILHFGTAEQKSRFLPPIAAGTETWW